MARGGATGVGAGRVVVSAFIAAFAGGLWAHFVTTFSPRAFYLTETFVALTMLIVGGPRTVSGAVIGTAVVTLLFQGLRTFENELNLRQVFDFQVVGLTEVVLAVLLIIVLALRPGGLVEEREILSNVRRTAPIPERCRSCWRGRCGTSPPIGSAGSGPCRRPPSRSCRRSRPPKTRGLYTLRRFTSARTL